MSTPFNNKTGSQMPKAAPGGALSSGTQPKRPRTGTISSVSRNCLSLKYFIHALILICFYVSAVIDAWSNKEVSVSQWDFWRTFAIFEFKSKKLTFYSKFVCRDDDFGAQYNFVPSNTLLEPNNVIPSWEFGDEETKEVSATLRRIRQKYDNIHKTVLAKERELEQKKVR